MLIKLIKTEWMKLNRSRMLWGMLVLVPLLELFVGTGNYLLNIHVFEEPGWMALWSQVGMFFALFFFPLLIAVCASYLWRMEHAGRNWNNEMTLPVRRSFLFLSKWVVLGILNFFTLSVLFVSYWVTGKFICDFTDAMPLQAVCWFLGGWIVSLAIGALQLFLSMVIRSFATPVALAFGAVMVGYKLYQHSVVWFAHTSLLQAMCFRYPERAEFPDLFLYGGVSLIWLVFWGTLAMLKLKYSDIK